jgi:glycosyltransferase involved in cell wall biosynthesis
VLSPIPDQGASYRFRVAQYLPYLRQRGFDVTVAPFYSPDMFRIVYLRGHYLAKARFSVSAAARVLARALGATHDLVLVHREAIPIGPPLVELLLARVKRRPLVFDFDDAVFLPNTSEANRLLQVLKFPRKVKAIMRASAAVTAGNDHLASYAARYNPAVTMVPTVVDTERWTPGPDRGERSGPLRVGWIGTPSTTRYLAGLGPVLEAVATTQRFTLRIAGTGEPLSFRGVQVEPLPWTLEGEVDLFNGCDVGVYPLDDDEWARGKCGLKAIQFMACGIPVVAAAVGVNRTIIQDGINGFLAASPEEWVEKLSWLLTDAALRAKLGRAGRETVVERYSLATQAPALAGVLETVGGAGAAA